MVVSPWGMFHDWRKVVIDIPASGAAVLAADVLALGAPVLCSLFSRLQRS